MSPPTFFGVTAAAEKSSSGSSSYFDLDFATVFIRQIISKKRPGISSVSLDIRAAALWQESKQYSRLHSCRGSDLEHASSFDGSAPAFDGAVQLVFPELSYNVQRLRKPEKFANDNLSFRDMKITVELIAALLRPS